jgi:hypothetical protein
VNKKVILIALVAVLSLAGLFYAYLYGTEMVVVHNRGDEAVKLALVTLNGEAIETSERRVAKPGGYSYLIITPKLTGYGAVECLGGDRAGAFALGQVSPKNFSGYYLSIDGCKEVLSVKHTGF